MVKKHLKLIIPILGLLMVGGGISAIIYQSSAVVIPTRIINPSYERAYGIQPFDEEYSKGILYRRSNQKDAAGNSGGNITVSYTGEESDCSDVENLDANNLCHRNTSKDSSYLFIPKGAIYNGEYLDVREYRWSNEGTAWIYYENRPSISVGKYISGDGQSVAHREFHFFKAGTNTEVSFKGIISFNDLDYEEGYIIEQGYHQTYISSPSALQEYDPISVNKWVGVGNYENPYTKEDEAYELWVEFESTPSKPFTIAYVAPGGRGSDTYTYAQTVSFNVSGSKPSDYSAPQNDIIARYGTLTLPAISTADPAYTFDGWYYDSALTNKAGSKITVPDEDVTLYGKFTKEESPSVNTTIKNGEVTSSSSNIPIGGNWTVNYKCNSGYQLSSIKADDLAVDINTYASSYTFKNISAGAHTLAIVCDATPKASVTTSIAYGTITASNDNITNNTNFKVTYSCKNYYTLSNVAVDGIALDASSYPSAYTFANITGSHNIAVTCTETHDSSVTTSIEGGTITESKDDIRDGSDYTVEYTCDEKTVLSSVLIDNEAIDIEKNPKSYIFEKIEGEHTVSVKCESEVHAPETGNTTKPNDNTDNNEPNFIAIFATMAIVSSVLFIVYRLYSQKNAANFKRNK